MHISSQEGCMTAVTPLPEKLAGTTVSCDPLSPATTYCPLEMWGAGIIAPPCLWDHPQKAVSTVTQTVQVPREATCKYILHKVELVWNLNPHLCLITEPEGTATANTINFTATTYLFSWFPFPFKHTLTHSHSHTHTQPIKHRHCPELSPWGLFIISIYTHSHPSLQVWYHLYLMTLKSTAPAHTSPLIINKQTN